MRDFLGHHRRRRSCLRAAAGPRPGGGRWRTLLLAGAASALILQPVAPGSGAERFQADEWRAECAGGAPGTECSIIVPFRSHIGDGSFALVLDVASGVVAIVGEPPPLAATLQVDKNPAVRCSGPRHCLFALGDSAAAARQLASGSIALISVVTKKGAFDSSLSAKGFRTTLAKIKAWRYPRAKPGR